MLEFPTERGTRLKITNLTTGKYIIKYNKNHCLAYFFYATLINGELLEYKNISHNQVFKFKGDTYLIEIISKDDACELVY